MDNRSTSKRLRVILAGLLIGILSILIMAEAVKAEASPQPRAQSTATPAGAVTPTGPAVTRECSECHPDKRDLWGASPHALAFDNMNFQEGWKSMGQPGECLLCHTTNYQEATGEYAQAGVSCEACHGPAIADHPAADYPVRSDKESCGTCHPATVGEAQISGHTGMDEVGCVDCHDPHSQAALFKNPDDMCKECHKEDLAAMDEVQGKLHLRENVTCVDCHTLDVPHTFLYNFRQNDLAAFMSGRDCSVEVSANLALQTGSNGDAQAILQAKMDWPVVHRVSRAKSALKCADCHEMDEKLRDDFKLLGYSDADLNQIAWQDESFPAITDNDLNRIVSRPKSGWSWIFWLLGVALILVIFEVSVTRRLKKPKPVVKDE